jgi:GT2 family glycosyltransferase
MSSISVVIPTFNRAMLVKRAVDSALQQAVQPGQVIVVDDGSTDQTAAVLREYGDAVEYVWQGNAGAAAARNGGLRVARHPWIAFLDSDDYWTPRHLERIVAAIADTDGKGRFYFSDMGFSSNSRNTTLWEIVGFRPQQPYHLTRDATAWMLMRRQPTMVQCSVFKTDVLKEYGGFDPAYRVTEDVDLFCRLGIEGAACAVAGVGCVQTSDDRAENRLTATAKADTETYWTCQVMLWRGVLARFPGLELPYRRLVRYHLASAGFRLSRSLWHSKKRARSAWAFLQSVGAEPRFLAWMIRHHSVQGWDVRIRPRCAEVEHTAQVL